jgi:DNA-binding MarR family transcriptional regulator
MILVVRSFPKTVDMVPQEDLIVEIPENRKAWLLKLRWCDARYKFSNTQQAEANKDVPVLVRNQAQIAELFNVDRSTISRMMKEVREKELVKAVR